jgi:hypothetical protein
MKSFYPETGTTEEWNSAYYRLEDYFRAHRVTNKVHQSQIILRILQRAAARHAQSPGEPPTKLALEEAYAEMDRWFQQLIADPELPLQRASIMGRVSMHILDAPDRWPNVFLAQDALLPPDFRAAMRESSIRSGPDLAVSSMVPRPLDASPVAELLDETWERLSRLSVALLVGILSLFIGGALFYFARILEP